MTTQTHPTQTHPGERTASTAAPEPVTVTDVVIRDIRFPTSRSLDGSDAMNKDPDYSAAYVELRAGDTEVGTSLVFTIGRGNEVVAAAIRAYAHHIVGWTFDGTPASLRTLAQRLTDDSQLRWLGPEKGVAHMASGVLVNAAWDLASRAAGVPLWQYLAELTPEELVSCVDFRYLTDALTPERALEILRAAEPGRAERAARLRAEGYPAYTTTPGWLGYSDEKLVRLAKEAVADGFDMIKLKVGDDVEDDIRRMSLAREAVGEHIRIATDANQRWDVAAAVEWMERLKPYDPWWIEEPTAPDDALAHAAIRRGVAPIKVATGEHAHNRVLVKQLLQAEAIDVFQLDAARVGGVNELIAILLLCAAHDVPVCPHAGGVGLCEMVQHLAMFDYVAVSGTLEGRRIEFVDHLHEHFTAPAVISGGRYVAPTAPGSGAQMVAGSLDDHEFPDGPVWAGHDDAAGAHA